MLHPSGRVLLESFLFLVWGGGLALTVAGAFVAARSLRKTVPAASPSLPPVSVLKPLKGLDEGLRENLESFFLQRYPNWELVFSVGEEDDAAVPLVLELMAKHPRVPARLLVGAVGAGINPKVNNLVKPFALAAHDWVLISDSNTRVDPHFLERLAAGIGPGVALRYCVVAGTGAQGLGGRLDAVSLNTMYARGTLLAAAGGFPCVTGKAMLLRKAALEELGGIAAFAPEVAEDFVIGQAFLRRGLGVSICADPVQQHVGRGCFSAYWSRTVRWGRIRKLHAPKLIFLLEPLLFTSVGSGIAGAVAMNLALHVSPFLVFAANGLLWGLCDAWLLRSLGLRMSVRDAGAWLLRELLHPLQWAHIALGDTVEWRGAVLKMQPSGVLENVSVGRASRA